MAGCVVRSGRGLRPVGSNNLPCRGLGHLPVRSQVLITSRAKPVLALMASAGRPRLLSSSATSCLESVISDVRPDRTCGSLPPWLRRLLGHVLACQPERGQGRVRDSPARLFASGQLAGTVSLQLPGSYPVQNCLRVDTFDFRNFSRRICSRHFRQGICSHRLVLWHAVLWNTTDMPQKLPRGFKSQMTTRSSDYSLPMLCRSVPIRADVSHLEQ